MNQKKAEFVYNYFIRASRMCRLIMALGDVSAQKIAEAAITMSEGKTADADSPIRCHANGWGMMWKQKNIKNNLSVFRHEQTISESISQAPLNTIDTNFLAIHVRHATLPHTMGLEYTHPISSQQTELPWYMLHNGFLPTVHEHLNLERSNFDTREYFDYIIPATGDTLPQAEIIKKLSSLKAEGTSANAIIANYKKAYVIHWSMPHVAGLNYYHLYQVKDKNTLYIASEIQPAIANRNQWQKLESSSVLEFSLDKEEFV